MTSHTCASRRRASVYRPALGELFRIPEALIRIRALAGVMREPRPLGDFLPVVPPERRGEPVVVRSAVASTFVAALELCRGAVVGLDQAEVFGTIMVSPQVGSGAAHDVGGRLRSVVSRCPRSHAGAASS